MFLFLQLLGAFGSLQRMPPNIVASPSGVHTFTDILPGVRSSVPYLLSLRRGCSLFLWTVQGNTYVFLRSDYTSTGLLLLPLLQVISCLP